MSNNKAEISSLVQKISKDIIGISCKRVELNTIRARLKSLKDRCSQNKINGCKVLNVIPFNSEEEKDYFDLFCSIRLEITSCSDENLLKDLLLDFKSIRDILACQHIPLVDHWVGLHCGKRARRLMDDSERKGEGNKVLIDCIDRFDPERGVKFSGYLYKSLDNMMFKDSRDTKKHKVLVEDPDFTISSSIHSGKNDNEDTSLVEAKMIWEDINNGVGAAKFLSDVERAIIMADFADGSQFTDQDEKAKSLNMNTETYRKRKRNALQKIKEAICQRSGKD